ncbi:Uncharacterized protein Fot_38378 [Forsythia ovata]|uniref:Uncharacterized protein n=1 Tax=Forsythia ovata TaxID=205694 RepID=A0ABD1S1N4_9LAMI
MENKMDEKDNILLGLDKLRTMDELTKNGQWRGRIVAAATCCAHCEGNIDILLLLIKIKWNRLKIDLRLWSFYWRIVGPLIQVGHWGTNTRPAPYLDARPEWGVLRLAKANGSHIWTAFGVTELEIKREVRTNWSLPALSRGDGGRYGGLDSLL